MPAGARTLDHPRRLLARWGWIAALLALVAIVAAVAVLPPLAQPQMLRGLADTRTLFGIPNFLNVVSNLPFLVAGLAGLHFLARDRAAAAAFEEPKEKLPYAVCFLGVALVSVGSSYYHLVPDGAHLMWDRLPMTLTFMALLAATVAERVSVKAGLRCLLPLLIAGVASVLYWRWSVLQGDENLLPYAAVQYGSIAVIIAMALLRRSRYTHGSDIFVVAAIYALAKAAEVLDGAIYALGHVVSGHTLKHP